MREERWLALRDRIDVVLADNDAWVESTTLGTEPAIVTTTSETRGPSAPMTDGT